MFNDLALLVQEQSEMLENIELNMEDAKNYVDKGEEHIVQAKKWYQQTRSVFHLFFLTLP
jgi:t-SNARE complex subunit (syntaxin)